MNVQNRISRIISALSRCDTPDSDNARLAPEANGTVHLPADATPAERLLFEQIRSMAWSVLAPSYVTSVLFVED